MGAVVWSIVQVPVLTTAMSPASTSGPSLMSAAAMREISSARSPRTIDGIPSDRVSGSALTETAVPPSTSVRSR